MSLYIFPYTCNGNVKELRVAESDGTFPWREALWWWSLPETVAFLSLPAPSVSRLNQLVALANLANSFVKCERNTNNFLSSDWMCWKKPGSTLLLSS